MHKTNDHWNQIRRSKSYLGNDYFPTFHLKSSNLIEMFINNTDWKKTMPEDT
jgi:hypothetical protein